MADIGEISNELVDWLRHELVKAYDKELLETVWGPAIYGAGNFEVYLENDNWYMRAVEGYKPAVPLGILPDQISPRPPKGL